MRRTDFIIGSAALALVAAFGLPQRARAYAVSFSDDQWKSRLGPDRYYILRQNGTEPAFSSPLIGEKRAGIYRCAGCDQALFTSKTKYDSGDGWPSFWDVLPRSTVTRADYEIPMEPRTEVHCSRCGGHLGHIFPDGPQPTYKRYCIDGLALKFLPA